MALQIKNNLNTSTINWLLPILMNGQVTVGEAASELGMVAEDNGKYN
jgi:type I restriction enzyme S subunit